MRGVALAIFLTSFWGCSGCEANSPANKPAHVALGPRAVPTPSDSVRVAPAPEQRTGAGPLYAAVRDLGVVRIDQQGATPVWRSDNTIRDLRVGPDKALWFSAWSDGTFRLAGGEARKVGDESFEKLAIASASDVWAISDSHGHVAHYDGERWTNVRDRSSFGGFYSDNKLLDIAVGEGLVWVAMWNGLWQYDSRTWNRIEPPPASKPHAFTDIVFATGNQIVARFGRGLFVRKGDAWRRRPWPHPGYALWDVHRAGFAVGWTPDAQRLAFGRIDGSSPALVGAPLQASRVQDVAIDDAGRSWVATDFGLRLVDPQGNVVESRQPGTVPGIHGEVYLVAVAGSGPGSLPAQEAAARDVEGRVLIYKSRKPLADTVVELCPSPSRKRGCAGASFVRRAKTDKDGQFRFHAIPDGTFGLHVPHPDERPECRSPFTQSAMVPVVPARRCGPAKPGAEPCELAVSYVCMPFEMPPPPPP